MLKTDGGLEFQHDGVREDNEPHQYADFVEWPLLTEEY